MNIATQRAQWRVNYDVGYVGFVIRQHDAIAAGIQWFEDQWGCLTGKLIPHHTLVIIGDDLTVEAFGHGVDYGTVSAYLDDPHTALLVRRPRHYTESMGESIKASAEKMVGHKYGYILIAAMAVSHSAVGRLLGWATMGNFQKWVAHLADASQQEICSELVARCLLEQPSLKDFSQNLNPPEAATPLAEFEDQDVFEPAYYSVELVR